MFVHWRSLQTKERERQRLPELWREPRGRRGKRLLVSDYRSKRVLQCSDKRTVWTRKRPCPKSLWKIWRTGPYPQADTFRVLRRGNQINTTPCLFLAPPTCFPLLFHRFSTETFTGTYGCGCRTRRGSLVLPRRDPIRVWNYLTTQ